MSSVGLWAFSVATARQAAHRTDACVMSLLLTIRCSGLPLWHSLVVGRNWGRKTHLEKRRGRTQDRGEPGACEAESRARNPGRSAPAGQEPSMAWGACRVAM